MNVLTITNRRYQTLGAIAALAGCLYCLSRAQDFSLYFSFVLGRVPDASILQKAFPLAIFALEIMFIFDHMLFIAVHWNSKKLEAARPENFHPFISLLIPTCNEPLSVIRSTLQAAIAIDYPQVFFEILLLDDGGSTDVENLVREINAQCSCCNLRYATRILTGKPRRGYKAANLNFGVSIADSKTEGFLLLDCDHVPSSSILKELTAYMYPTTMTSKAPKEHFGFVQSPQAFNIGQHDWWDRPCREFHFVTQSYRAYNDSVMLTGTSALISASALTEIGGFDETTVTEDILTGAKIQAAGFRTFFHENIVATGTVPETLRAILNQRIRWAQGSVQLIWKGMPLWRHFATRRVLTYACGISHFIMPIPYAALALIPPLAALCLLDPSLHYSSVSLILLGIFAIFRFLSRDCYCPKTLAEKTANCYLGLLYAPMYLFAIVTAVSKAQLPFLVTPKAVPQNQSVQMACLYASFPCLVCLANLATVIWLSWKLVASNYPAISAVLDYGPILVLASYFVLCGSAFLTVKDMTEKNSANTIQSNNNSI